MNAQELEERIQEIGALFYLLLANGQQLLCQDVFTMDGASITVIVGTEPQMILLHRIKDCSKTPLVA